MKFFVIGINHKECPIEIREKLHFSLKRMEDALSGLKTFPDISELIILSTCNRVELYGMTELDHLPEDSLLALLEKDHEIKRKDFSAYLYHYEDKAAIRHLFRVATGLDSLVVGENEILGQLREAFRLAVQYQTVNSLLYRLMEKALKVGKDVRTATKINEGAVSIPSVAVELAQKIFGKLTGEKVMVLGTGEMSALTLSNLKNAGGEAFYVVSRNQERGEKLAGEFGTRWISMEGWEAYLESVDILIASTSAPHPIVSYEQVKRVMSARRNRPLFMIDIAVPRDIESHVNSIDDVYLYNIDDLKSVSAANLRLRRGEMKAAEEMVEKAVLDFQAWLEQLKARPVMERFEKFVDEILIAELDRMMDETAETEEKKKELRQRIRAKLLHHPFEKIKESSQNGGVNRYVEALSSLFSLDKKQ